MTDFTHLIEKPIPGIYFGLPEGIYHRIQALGSTSIKKLAIDPVEFQFDRLYGEDSDDSHVLKFGNGLHARVLEGRAAYEDRFYVNVPPEMPDGVLKTTDDLKEFLSTYGQTSLSKYKKPDLIKLVKSLKPDAPIYDEIAAAHAAQHAGKTELNAKTFKQVALAADWLNRDPVLGASITDGAFNEGAPEVSVIVDDDGVMLKARWDRLLRPGIVDLKSYAPMFDEPLEKAFEKTVRRLGYKVQAADYIRIWHKAKDLFLAGEIPVFGEQPYDDFLADCFDREKPEWFWLAVKRKGAPSPFVVQWKGRLDFDNAMIDVERALDDYRRLRDEFGDENDWIPARPVYVMDDNSYYN